MNGILIVNKPKGITSRDLVNEVCKKLNTRHIGHAGTLDPIAQGVMVLGINDATKILSLLEYNDKTYIATVKIGVNTDTLDRTGIVLDNKDVQNFNYDKLKEVIKNFPKEYMQEVPKYSAVHVNGKRLYEYARNNIDVKLPKKLVKIYSLELLDINKENNTFKLKAKVSKGTYIRSLIRDIGTLCDNYMIMEELLRVEVGIFNIKDAYNLEDINLNTKLISIKDALSMLKSITVDDIIKKKVLNGSILKCDIDDLYILILDSNLKLLAIYQKYSDGYIKPFKVFREE